MLKKLGNTFFINFLTGVTLLHEIFVARLFRYFRVHCIVLCCVVLYYTVLYCILLYCIVLYLSQSKISEFCILNHFNVAFYRKTRSISLAKLFYMHLNWFKKLLTM